MIRHTPTPDKIFQLKITLVGVRPPIWRRVLVPASTKLSHLHLVIQAAMGWGDSHLHSFYVGQQEYTTASSEGPMFGQRTQNEAKVNVEDVLRTEGGKMRYLYDYGDSWEHTILLEKILEPQPGETYPTVIAGRRECPLEDCGGVWGHMQLVEAWSKPESERDDEERELLEWCNFTQNPDMFDVADANLRLRDSVSKGKSAR